MNAKKRSDRIFCTLGRDVIEDAQDGHSRKSMVRCDESRKQIVKLIVDFIYPTVRFVHYLN